MPSYQGSNQTSDIIAVKQQRRLGEKKSTSRTKDQTTSDLKSDLERMWARKHTIKIEKEMDGDNS